MPQAWCSWIPPFVLRSSGFLSGLETYLFELSEFGESPWQKTQRSEAAGQHKGCLFFWFVFFGQTKKMNSPHRAKFSAKNILICWGLHTQPKLRADYALFPFNDFRICWSSLISSAKQEINRVVSVKTLPISSGECLSNGLLPVLDRNSCLKAL